MKGAEQNRWQTACVWLGDGQLSAAAGDLWLCPWSLPAPAVLRGSESSHRGGGLYRLYRALWMNMLLSHLILETIWNQWRRVNNGWSEESGHAVLWNHFQQGFATSVQQYHRPFLTSDLQMKIWATVCTSAGINTDQSVWRTSCSFLSAK